MSQYRAARGQRRPWSRRVGSSVLAIALVSAGATLFTSATPSAAATSPFVVTVSPSAATVASGTPLTWTISVTNSGGAEVDGVSLVDQVPSMSGMTLTSSVGTCTQSAGQVSCNADTLLGFQAWTVTIQGTVTAANGSTLNNSATVSGNQASQSFSTTGTGSTLVAGPTTGSLADLTVGITAPSTAVFGAPVTYQLTVNNSGGANAQGVTVQDTLPAGFTFSSVNGTSVFTCSGGAIVTCTGGQVNAGANATIWIYATAAAGPAGPYTDTAVVNPTGFVVESNYANNSTTATTTLSASPPPASGFTLTKTAAEPAGDPLGDIQGPLSGQTDGETLTYTITGKNVTTKKAAGVVISDGTTGLDAAHVTASYQINGGPAVACGVSASVVTCAQKGPGITLDGGDTMVVTVAAPVVALSGSVITDTATITGTISNRANSATASVSVTVRPPVDLTVTEQATQAGCAPSYPATATTPPFRARDKFCYQIAVSNSGILDATGVTVREPLPPDVIFVSSANLTLPPNGGWAPCTVDASNVVTCTGGTVRGVASSGSPGGTEADIQLNLVAPDSIGPITATVTVNPFATIAESDYTNNTFTLTTPISTGIDLTVSQLVNFDPVAPSGTLVYTITVTNNGTQDTTGVTLQDTLPTGTIYRIAVDTVSGAPGPPHHHNFTCGPNGATEVDCAGGILLGTYANDPAHVLPDFATITVTLFAPVAYNPITNTLRVDPNNQIPEYDKTNNINVLTSRVQIPTVIGTQGTYNEFTIGVAQISPTGTPTCNGAPTVNCTAPNGILTWRLTVSNWGSDAASNITVQDFLPQGTRFRYANASPLAAGNGGFFCSQNSGVVTCTAGALTGWATNAPPFDSAGNVGGTATIDISVFAPDVPTTITDQADINPGNAIPEADTTNDVATLSTVVALGGGGGYIDLSLPSLTGDQNPVVPNGIENYTLVAQNGGTDQAFNVEVTDTIPAGSVFRSANDAAPGTTGAFTCSFNNGVVDCTGGSLPGTNQVGPPGGQRTINISIFAPAATGTATDLAQINPTRAIPEADYTNNSASLTVGVATTGGGTYIDLSVPTLTVAPKDSFVTSPNVTPGGDMTYAMTVKNTGTGDATNVEVKDVLPVGVVFESVTADHAFSCSATGGNPANGVGPTVDCTGGTILGTLTHAGCCDVANISITAAAPQETDTTLLDQATVNPTNVIPESDYSNNSNTVSNKVESAIDLSIGSYSSSSCSQNNNCDYTATVTNTAANGGSGETAGSPPIANVQVHFTMPVGVIIEAVTPTGGAGTWSCQTQQNPVNVVDCVGQNMQAGGSESIDITVFDTTSASLANQSTVTVNPNGTIVESDQSNDTNDSMTA